MVGLNSKTVRTCCLSQYPQPTSMRDRKACDTIDLVHLLQLQLATEDLSRGNPNSNPKTAFTQLMGCFHMSSQK